MWQDTPGLTKTWPTPVSRTDDRLLWLSAAGSILVAVIIGIGSAIYLAGPTSQPVSIQGVHPRYEAQQQQLYLRAQR